jgi:ferric-dicitrate binding protein FerR (iron transport regulator)
MIDSPDPHARDVDDDMAIRLLRLAGQRSPAPDLRAARVRAAVQSEWQRTVRRRTVRVRALVGAVFIAVAAAAAAVGRVTLGEPSGASAGQPVAVVEQLDGVSYRLDGSAGGRVPVRLSLRDSVRTGEWLETGPGARAGLRFGDGISVRLDAGTRVRARSTGSLELAAGAVYVDTGRETGNFEIRTVMGIARDVGTQFEVRLLDAAVRVRVRSGAVELRDRERAVSARAGTEITMSTAGVVSSAIAVHGPEWDWVGRLAPPLAFDGATLSEFLERVAREEGWVLRYADTALGREASAIILHGSVEGLTPIEAVDVAIASSGLRHHLQGGELIVRREMELP